MWLSSRPVHRISATGRKLAVCMALSALMMLSACTVQPLNATRSNIDPGASNLSQSTADILSRMEVAKATTRLEQQVRNALLFRLNGGEPKPEGNYKVDLVVTSVARTLAVETNALAPTSAQVELTGNYTLIDKRTGTPVAAGTHMTIAAYDRTPQSFANERALRDAENRGAKALAEQLRLAIAQSIAGT